MEKIVWFLLIIIAVIALFIVVLNRATLGVA